MVNANRTGDREDSKPCNACRQPIHPDATFCQICRNPQSPPRFQTLRLIGSLAAGLSLVAAVATYVLTNAPKLVRTAFGQEARLVSLDYTLGDRAIVSVQNAGDRALHVQSIEVALPAFGNAVMSQAHNVRFVVDAGKIVVRNPYAAEDAEPSAVDGMSYVSRNGMPDGWTPDVRGLQRLLDHPDCFGVSIHAPAASELRVVRAFYEQGGNALVTLPNEVRLTYFSGDAGRIKTADIDALAVLRWRRDYEDCPAPWDEGAIAARSQARSTTTDPTE